MKLSYLCSHSLLQLFVFDPAVFIAAWMSPLASSLCIILAFNIVIFVLVIVVLIKHNWNTQGHPKKKKTHTHTHKKQKQKKNKLTTKKNIAKLLISIVGACDVSL